MRTAVIGVVLAVVTVAPASLRAQSCGPLQLANFPFDGGSGSAVALDVVTGVVGAPNGVLPTKAWIIELDGGQWSVVKAVVPTHPPAVWGFGTSVAIDADTIVVGATLDLGFSQPPGSAWIYERNLGGPGNWGLAVMLTPSDGVPDQSFGSSVAIDGDTVLVGSVNAAATAGAAYVFNRNLGGPGAWGEVVKLVPPGLPAGERFGVSVSIDGDTAVIGASQAPELGQGAVGPGAVYVFGRNEGGPDNWGLTATITAGDGVVGERFGFAVALDGEQLLVGAPKKGSLPAHVGPGAAYVFGRDTGGPGAWGQVALLTAPDTESGDRLGTAVDIKAGWAIVGASGDRFASGPFGFPSGSAHVFSQDGGPGSWGHFLKLRGSTMNFWGDFGAAVAVSQVGVALVGNPSQDNNGDNYVDGAAYVFAIDGPDCNLNGVPDDCDLSNGLADENRNGLPDGCESDCNDNDVIDAIEIADALWADCNGNGVPDDCDIAGGALIDVDGDGYPDACDPRDCNGNGVPDVTDIAEGSSPDCNGNFMIDGCEVAGGLAWDDGTAEIVLGGFGLDPQPLLWANPFDAGTASVISAVSVALYDDGEIAVGDPITVYLWSDPNNDGVPDDAVLLAQATSTIGVLSDLIGGPEAFNQVPITPTRVSGGFFAGAIVTTGDRPLMSDDVPYPLYKGWGIVGFDDPLALQMAPANPWGVWLVRAIALDSNDNGVPDGCDCLADVDRSGAVGIVDLLALLAAWGGSGPADIDGDGVVGPLDFTLLLSGWGPC